MASKNKKNILVKLKTAKGKIAAIALGGIIVFGTWAGIHSYNNYKEDNKLREDEIPTIGDVEIPSDTPIEIPTEPNFEIPTEPNFEIPTEPEIPTEYETESDSNWQESESASESDSITDIPTDEPVVEQEISRDMAVSLINTLNLKVQDFLNANNNSRRPTFTGIEDLTMTPDGSGYTFVIKVEGFMNSVIPSYIQVTAHSTDEACDKLYEMFNTSLSNSFDVNLAGTIVQTLDTTLASEYTQVTGCKSLKSLTIDNQTTAIDTIFTKSNIEFNTKENYKFKSFVNTTPVTVEGINTYEIKINITGQLNSYFTTLTIASDKALNSQTINNYVVAILNDETVDIEYSVQTIEVPNSHIFKLVQAINAKLEEKELQTPSLSK